MTRLKTDEKLERKLEAVALAPILAGQGEKSGRLLAELAAECPPPLHRWFSYHPHRVIALGLDAALRGETGSDAIAINTYLSTLPHATAFEILTGKPVPSWKKCDYSDSALANIGGFNTVSDLANTDLAYSHNESLYAQSVRCAADRRQAIELLRESAIAVQQSNLRDGPAPVLGELAQKLASIGQRGTGGCIGEYLGRALVAGDRQAALRANGIDLRPQWGLHALDVMVPLVPGRLYVLAATTGGGKTSLALQAALATAQAAGRQSVAYASLEMRGEELARILAARTLGIPASAIERGEYRETDDKPRLEALALEWRTSGTLLVRDVEGGTKHTVHALLAWCAQRQALAGGRLALVVFDYLQLIEPDDHRQSEYQSLSRTTRAVKLAAVALNVPILLLSQLNREGRKGMRDRGGNVAKNPEPRLEDLRGSGSIEQDADTVMFLYEPDAHQEASHHLRSITAIVAKNRTGPRGTAELTFEGKTQTFTACAAEQREPETVEWNNR